MQQIMTEQEKLWFDALTSYRSKGADLLEEPFMRGVQRSVVDKYSDQAHFIYELLQNADDVKATTAKFILETNGLYFVHSGSVRFTVSNPQNEGTDMGVHLADVHIACMGIEKIVPRREHLGVFLRLLARSATGQPITTYSSHFKSPRVGAQLHIVLVDNGRSSCG